MINSITSEVAANTDVEVFNTSTVNVAIKGTIIYNKSSDDANVLLKFKNPEDFTFLNLIIKPSESLLISDDIYVPINNSLVINSTQDVNVVFSFIEDTKVNTIV